MTDRVLPANGSANQDDITHDPNKGTARSLETGNDPSSFIVGGISIGSPDAAVVLVAFRFPKQEWTQVRSSTQVHFSVRVGAFVFRTLETPSKALSLQGATPHHGGEILFLLHVSVLKYVDEFGQLS